MVREERFRGVKIENKIMHKLSAYMIELYKRHRHWRLLMIKNFSKNMGVKTIFVRVKPVGYVTATYTIDPQRIHVKTDFKLRERGGLQKIFLLNEQGSRFFRKYFDSNGKVLFDKRIGAWEKVEADWACISSKSGEVGFRLRRFNDIMLHRGREFLEGILDWVGLDYEVEPQKTRFEYDIEVFGSPKQK